MGGGFEWRERGLSEKKRVGENLASLNLKIVSQSNNFDIPIESFGLGWVNVKNEKLWLYQPELLVICSLWTHKAVATWKSFWILCNGQVRTYVIDKKSALPMLLGTWRPTFLVKQPLLVSHGCRCPARKEELGFYPAFNTIGEYLWLISWVRKRLSIFWALCSPMFGGPVFHFQGQSYSSSPSPLFAKQVNFIGALTMKDNDHRYPKHAQRII